MGGSGEVAEAAVVAAAVERGFVQPAQVEAARQACAAWAAAGTPVSLLALVSARHLDERQRDALRAVYRAALARERPATVVGLDPRAGAVDPHEETQALDRPRVPAGPPPPVQLRVPSILAKRPSGGAPAAPPARPPSGGTPAARPLSVTHLGDGPLPPPSAALDPAATRLDPGSVVARGAPTGTAPGADGRTVADGLPAAPKAPPPGDATWWQASLEGEAPAAPGAPAAPAAGAGARLGRWELVSELGRGAMGVVYEARDPGLDRRVALKVLLAGAGASPTDVARFQLEGKAAARLDHPAIVRVIDLAADDEGRWLLALELVRGESLISRLRRAGPLPWREVAKLGRTLAEALAHAHEQGVLHRDVKPHNVLLGADGQARLADFGLAKLQGGKALTAAGAVLGTPAYMAPEQVDPDRGEPDARADLYALGATLYHALAGRPPFVAASPSALLHAVQFTEPDPPSLHRGASPDEAPPDLERVVLRCLAKSPGGRYGSGSALADDLGRVLAGTRLPLDAGATVASGARRAAEAGPSRRSAWLVGAACVVVGVGGGLLIVGWRAFQQERDRRAEAEHVAALERDARQAVGDRVTETPPETEPAPPPTEASPPATEASPPATEPPPPPTEASPPVTEPSPPATEPPPPASEPPPPATEPPPTEPSPPASAPELGPGEWLRARLLVPAGEVPWTAFEAGLVEARARNVPVVVFAVSVSLEQDDEFPTLFRDPEVAELLTSAVVAVGSQHVDAQHAHTETLSPGGQPRCRLWRTLPCAAHERARQEASQRGADVSDLDGAWRLLVVSPDGAVRVLLGPAGQTRRGEPVPTYSPRALAAAVEALQRELGPPAPLPDLLDAGRRLLAAEGHLAGDAREVAASLRGDERAGGVLARWADELARRAAR